MRQVKSVSYEDYSVHIWALRFQFVYFCKQFFYLCYNATLLGKGRERDWNRCEFVR